MYDVKERDWKLLRKLVPGWQERYMEKLRSTRFMYSYSVIK